MNHLAAETSPYLRQHAEDPVHWYPWGEAALSAARESGRPILLSIGYAACHWCHVMHHESFTDPAVAARMNRDFINIKVDREERPDLDRIYQLAQQVLTQRPGGWPLTMFLTPDQVPFFGGTYFPSEPRHGLPGFADLLERVTAYLRDAEDLTAQREALLGFFAGQARGADPVATLSDAPLAAARDRLEQVFDARWGGFGGAPKFPHPGSIALLLRHWRASAHQEQPDLQALYMATYTLHRMADGGVSDALGGGVFRYAVDAAWEIPHFEKMLYDNAQLLPLYAEAALATGDAAYAEAARAIAAWMLDEMAVADGLLASSLDADSEGHEGRYYAFEPDELRAALGDDYAVAAARYGWDGEPNFEGGWHLHGHASVADVATALTLDAAAVVAALDRAHAALRELRAGRVRPSRDDKALTAWNALAIEGLARAGRLLGEPTWIGAADRAAARLRQLVWAEGRLLAVHMAGRSHGMAFLDDHAFLLNALLELLQCRWRDADLSWARDLAELMLDRFADPGGGFLFTADDHERLIHRPRPMADEALPAGNAIAARALGRLGHLLGEPRYLDAAELTLRRAQAEMQRQPEAYTAMLDALEEALVPPELVVVRGPDAAAWVAGLATVYAPHRLLYAVPGTASDTALPAPIAAMDPEGETRAWICQGAHCSAPVRSQQALIGLLGGR
jgi:uncharacterized protein